MKKTLLLIALAMNVLTNYAITLTELKQMGFKTTKLFS